MQLCRLQTLAPQGRTVQTDMVSKGKLLIVDVREQPEASGGVQSKEKWTEHGQQTGCEQG